MSDQNQGTSPTTYTVAEGDTVFQIAQKVYGDGNRWQAIYNANQAAIGNDSTQLKAGTVLVIPSASQESDNPNPPSWSNPTFRHW